MKKILSIAILFVLIVMALQISTFADMGAPEIEPYKATITNVEGAKYWVDEVDAEVAGTLEYGTTIDVLYEIEYWKINKQYAYFQLDDSSNMTYRVELKDITAIKNEKDIKIDHTKSFDIVVLAENGVEMYTGPSYAYSKVGVTIPKKTEIKECYYVHSGNPWRYVTYNGTSGWICELNGSIGYKEEISYKVLAPRTVSVYKNVNFDTVVQKIPANTLVTDTLIIDDWSQAIYVTYDGVSGYVRKSECATNNIWAEELGTQSSTYEVNYPAKMYKEGNAYSEVLIENIPEGTTLEYTMAEDIRAYGWIYTTYNGTKGWVYYMEFADNYEEAIEGAKYPENTDVIGAVKEDLQNNSEANLETEKIEEPTATVSGKQTVVLCIAGAVIIALTAFVTITLVNKKKKEKNN